MNTQQNMVSMMSVAQILNFRKTIKPHVNEISFTSLAQVPAPMVSK